MHQTIREFFLRPHDAVVRSAFFTRKDEAYRMISTTCIRYLILHHEELKLKVSKFANDWTIEDFRAFTSYLDKRSFIKYSLEYLLQRKDDDDDLRIFPLLSNLMERINNSPPSPAFCLLKQLFHAGKRTDMDIIQRQLDRMIYVAAIEGYSVAVSILLAAASTTDCYDKNRETRLHLAARNGHGAVVQILIDKGVDIGFQSFRDPVTRCSIKRARGGGPGSHR
jgi:hypothetical protein